MSILKNMLVVVAMLLLSSSKGEAQTSMSEKPSDFPKYTVFSAGENNVNSYRIPSLIVAKDGSIVVFCEARRESWRDKSRTDIVIKRSSDNGKTWSTMLDLTKGNTGAFMDPTPLMDYSTGRIFLFTTFWPANDHSGKTNKAILLTSDDNGKTWSKPMDITEKLVTKERYIYGFGPGAGIQMTGKKLLLSAKP